jgi:hypothetical protein
MTARGRSTDLRHSTITNAPLDPLSSFFFHRLCCCLFQPGCARIEMTARGRAADLLHSIITNAPLDPRDFLELSLTQDKLWGFSFVP